MRGKVTRNEWRWVAMWIIVVLIVTSVPYVVGWLRSTPDKVFGGFAFAIEDGYSYLAKMKQGADGSWLFQLSYTSEAHTPTIFFLFHLLLGKLSAMTGLSTPLIYHLARLVCDAILLAVLYRFVALFTAWQPVRRIAFLLLVFSGGLGWLLLLTGQGNWLGSAPIDLISPEGYTFLILYGLPHLALARALLLLGFIRLWPPNSTWRGIDAVRAGINWLVAGFLVPFIIVVAGAVSMIALIVTVVQQRRIPWRIARSYVIAGLIAAPIALYSFLLFTFDPVLRVWSAQNQILSPHPLHYAAGYALLGVLALIGIGKTWRRHRIDARLLGWLAVVPFLLYVPFNLQRRLIESWQIPLAICAAMGLVYAVLPAWSRSRLVKRLIQHKRYTVHGLRSWFIAGVLLLSVTTYVLMLVEQTTRMFAQIDLGFRDGAEITALHWLDERVASTDVILSSYNTGNFLPALVGAKVFLGHGPETAYSEEKRKLVAQFYDSATSDEWRQDFLHQWPITYVFVGPQEKKIGQFDPTAADYLKLVYDQNGYQIYRVVRPSE